MPNKEKLELVLGAFVEQSSLKHFGSYKIHSNLICAGLNLN